jgi:hypothetical protein
LDDNALLSGNASIAPWLKNGGLEVKNAQVALPAGRYFLKHVKLTNKAKLGVQPGATVELFVEGTVSVENLSLLGVPAGATGTLLIVSGASDAAGQSIDLRNNANASFRLYAPAATVTLSNNVDVSGAIVAKKLNLENNQTLTMEPGLGTMPPPLTCP